MTLGDTMLLDSYRLALIDIHEARLEALHALSISVGWPHRAEDWDMLRQIGQGRALTDGIGRVLGTAMWFPYGGAFMTIGMVITTPRLQANGGGRWLMRQVTGEAGHRAIGLNATRAAWRLYTGLSFTPDAKVYQRNAIARPPPAPPPLPPGAQLRPLATDDLAAIAALDAQAFGAHRGLLLAELMKTASGTVLLRGEEIVAFALCRPFGRGHVVGPIVAASDEVAIAVAAPLMAPLAGRFLRIDTRRAAGPFADFIGACGLPLYDVVTSMSLGRRWIRSATPDGTTPHSFALASQALG
ncbi:GNAT family N-acetyltransferase [Acidisoma sp. C75]